MQTLSYSDGFVALAQSNSLTRDAALLRAATELFVQVPERGADEVLRYCELAIHLLPKVESRHRAFVAEGLAERKDVPKAIVLQLAKDAIEVAAPVLRHSPLLDADDLLAIIAATGSLHHRLIARRGALAPNVVLGLTRLDDPAVDAALAESALPTALRHQTETEPTGTDQAADDGEDEADYGAVAFLAQEREQRLNAIARQASRAARPRSVSTGAVLDRLVRRAWHAADIAMMARTGRKGDLIRAFAEGLSLDPGLVNRLIEEPAGEGLVLMCKAIGLGEVEARQVLLLANPHVGHSTQAFYRLADLHAGMERAVAERIIASWRGETGRPAARHVPQFAPQRERPTAAPKRAPLPSRKQHSEAG